MTTEERTPQAPPNAGGQGANIYGNPRSWHLTTVGSIDVGDGYDFDIFLVLVDDFGELYYATDSGCSCPTPFEDYTHMGQLDRARNANDIERALKAWFKDNGPRVGSSDLHAGDLLVRKAERMQLTRRA